MTKLNKILQRLSIIFVVVSLGMCVVVLYSNHAKNPNALIVSLGHQLYFVGAVGTFILMTTINFVEGSLRKQPIFDVIMNAICAVGWPLVWLFMYGLSHYNKSKTT